MADAHGLDPTDQEIVRSLLRAVPGLADADFELTPLPGGTTNRNYLLTRTDIPARLVVRVPGDNAHLLGIDREVELAASLSAAALGVGPPVVAFMRPQAILVTGFIEGTPLSPEAMARPDVLRRAAASLRRVHDGPAIPGRFDALDVVSGYLELARTRGVRVPDRLAATHLAVERVVATGITRISEPVPCHNDLLASNLIDDGSTIRIVDWEYAGMGDPFFDLGNLSANHDLSPEQDALLLEAYDARAPHPARLARLALMRVVSDYREAAWGILQAGISALDFDFLAYAGEHLERLLASASGPAFEESLALAASR